MFDVTILPSPQQHYIDDHGTKVTIISVEEKRVVFMRDGYPYPCMRPMHNFLAKFQEIPKRTNNIPINE
ncbi:DUF4222 domain-containing protein [Citrobacter braakii]|uniref:DUF4222 domain-containing protein n=1 Tax=Citrobacter braakii TaxID=57706 RepID=UPI003C303ABF|nr:DUF4222 domain-containing protein [Citrobacter freundii]